MPGIGGENRDCLGKQGMRAQEHFWGQWKCSKIGLWFFKPGTTSLVMCFRNVILELVLKRDPDWGWGKIGTEIRLEKMWMSMHFLYTMKRNLKTED